MKLATAVVISYNRHDVLRRQILYYANKPIHVVLADGSDADWGSGASGSIGEMSWEYFRISGFHTYLKRMAEGCRRVKTEFMFFVDDEECILWTGIKSAVEFLKQNPDHSCAGGRIDHFLQGKKELVYSNVRWGRTFSLIDNDAMQRVVKLVQSNRTASIYYQVQRTKFIKFFSSEIEHFQIANKYSGTVEVIFTIFLLCHGKWTRGNYPFHFRFGGSITRPPSEPDFMSESDVNEAIDWVKSLTYEVFTNILESTTSDLTWQDLSLSMILSYGESTFAAKRLRDTIQSEQDSTISIEFKRFLRSSVLLFLPQVFEKLYPNDLMRLKTYAALHSAGFADVVFELTKFRYIWVQFPKGLTMEQFEYELAKAN